ncbi:MAG: nucleotide exchange factor GrpE [Anaerolineales bacterium]|jgi:molecular chaperone GrpE|nr:nucleotide exchange factor GrpE [Anaerolineales bacterium]
MPKKNKESSKEEQIDKNLQEKDSVEESQEQPETIKKDEQVLPDTKSAIEDESISLEEKLELVQVAWNTSETKAAEYLDGWQRAKAEFANYKKRVIRDREQNDKDAIGKVVTKYLSAVDDLERALKEKPENEDTAAWANGIELIYRKLVTSLENDGVIPMKVDGEMFDPNRHEAIAQLESKDHESGQIIDVIQTGYMIGERVLRPARVCIAA